jgi:hypothetical protein
MAPKFNVVSKPNDSMKTVQSSTAPGAGGELSEHKQTQLQFWTVFKEFLEQKKSVIRCQKPFPQNWMNHAIGRAGIHLTSVASGWNSETETWDPEIRTELVMDDQHAKTYFALLNVQKEEIEREFGQLFIWYNPPNKKSARIYLRRNADFLNRERWPEQHEWLRTNHEKMHHVFGLRVRQLTATKFGGVTEGQAQGAMS